MRVLTFIIHLTAILDHTSLAIPLLLRRVGVVRCIGTGIPSIGVAIDVHVLKAHGQKGNGKVSGSGGGRPGRRTVVIGNVVGVATGSLVRTRATGRRRHCRPEGRGTSLESRLDRRIGAGLVTRNGGAAFVRQLASVTGRHGTSGDTAETRVVVVEVLLGVVIRAVAEILARGCTLVRVDVSSRVRALQLRRRRDDMAPLRGREDGVRAALTEVLQIKRMAKRVRRLRRRSAVDLA